MGIGGSLRASDCCAIINSDADKATSDADGTPLVAATHAIHDHAFLTNYAPAQAH